MWINRLLIYSIRSYFFKKLYSNYTLENMSTTTEVLLVYEVNIFKNNSNHKKQPKAHRHFSDNLLNTLCEKLEVDFRCLK